MAKLFYSEIWLKKNQNWNLLTSTISELFFFFILSNNKYPYTIAYNVNSDEFTVIFIFIFICDTPISKSWICMKHKQMYQIIC